MNPPCIAAVWYLIPAVSASLAKRLAKEGLSQSQIASKLGITRAAVSQYISGKRGTELKLGKKSKKALDALAKKLAAAKSESGDAELSLAMCEICAIARKEKVLCGLHRKSGADKACKICCGSTCG
ncbi:MAG: helix-turn-helix domain-containing protein [Candidatus Micrarchaeia archaeon]